MKNNFILSNFYCTQCGQKGIPIQRKKGQLRKPGHLKKLFCLKCEKETNHCECVPFSKYTYEDFQNEFLNNNFTKEGTRVLSYNQLKEKLKKVVDINEA